MKYLRTLFLAAAIVLSFSLVNYSSAMMAVPPSYGSLCSAALQGYDVYEEGKTHAYVSYESSEAEAKADGWTLGTRVYYSITETSELSWSNYANADFKQEFVVTDDTVASTITFAYNGSMSVSGENVDFAASMYSMGTDITVNQYDSFNFWTSTKYEKYDIRKDADDEYDTWDYSGTFEITYAAGELIVGETFFLAPSLHSFFGAEVVGFVGSGNVVFDNNFYNSLRPVSIEGGIEAVPIPGAVWLLGSGLIAMVGIRRKFKK